MVSNIIILLIFVIIIALILKIKFTTLIIIIVIIMLVYLLTYRWNQPIPVTERFGTNIIPEYENPNISNIDQFQFCQDGHMGYGNYYYIPIQEYIENGQKINNQIPRTCQIPSTISEYCVNKKVLETGNLQKAIDCCSRPGTISGRCGSNY